MTLLAHLLIADIYGIVGLTIGVLAWAGFLVGMWYVSRVARPGTVLAISACLFVFSKLIDPGEMREMHLIVGIMSLSGFTGGLLGLIDLFRTRGSESSMPKRIPTLKIVIGGVLGLLFLLAIAALVVFSAYARRIVAEAKARNQVAQLPMGDSGAASANSNQPAAPATKPPDRAKSGTVVSPPARTPRPSEMQADLWIKRASSFATQLATVTDSQSASLPMMNRLEQQARELVGRSARITALAQQDANSPADLQVAPETRKKLREANEALARERERLQTLDLPELKNRPLLSLLASDLLGEPLSEKRLATSLSPAAAKPDSEMAKPAPASTSLPKEVVSTQRFPTKAARQRDFHEDANWAIRLNRSHDARALLLADFLIRDDEKLVEEMRWSPALKRPTMLLTWAYGVELNGFPGTGPANLRASKGPAETAAPKSASDMATNRRLDTLTGDIGKWLTEGLFNRVDEGHFGDWGKDVHRGAFGHAGIVRLGAASADALLELARVQNADLLLLVGLTMDRGATTKPVTTMVVQIEDVQSGDTLWKSKPITNTRIVTGNRQGKDLASEFASLVLAYIDDELALREAPKLTRKQFHARLDTITALGKSDGLASLVELRYLRARKYLPDAKAQQLAAEIVGEENAKRLLSADETERRAAIEPLVPKGR